MLKKMKSKYLKLLCLVAILVLGSCKKSFLTQYDPDSIAVANYFRTENDVLLAVNGCYSLLRSSNTIGENSDLWTDQRSDDTGTNDNQSNAGEPFQFNNFSLIPTNSYLYAHWLAMYNVIANCNVVLSNIDKVSFASASTKQNYKAEAEFIRALIYFHLVREWGDVPLVTTQLTTTAQVTANTFRTPQLSVYKQIVADLKDAVASPLPATQSAGVAGRISLAAVNTLLGQVYLTMATTEDPTNQTANLNSALSYLTAAYNAKSFSNLSSIPYASVFDVAQKGTNPELIWQIVYKQGDPVYSSSIAANSQAKGETTDSQKPSSGVGNNVTHDLVFEYEAGDPRMAFSIKYANDPTVKDWYITKFRDVSSGAGINGYGGNDWILMRYADVILMLAEVNNYLGNTAAAIQYVDMVRARAGMPSYELSIQNPTYAASYPTLKLAILHERRVELAFEHHRWFDLLRTFNDNDLNAYFHAKSQANFGFAQLANFGAKDRYYPIPFNETKLDPVKMYQNPGY
jgi:hypothetical protein